MMESFSFDFEIEKWHRYLAFDEDGKGFLFHKEPVLIEGYQVPSEFRKQMFKSSFSTGKNRPDLAGKIFKRRKVKKEYFWEEV